MFTLWLHNHRFETAPPVDYQLKLVHNWHRHINHEDRSVADLYWNGSQYPEYTDTTNTSTYHIS